MGFSLKKMFSGSGWKKFKRTIGGVAKLAVGVVPGVGGIAGRLLDTGVGKLGAKAYRLGSSTAQVLKASPVMPGGAVSTPGGMAPPMATPPAQFGGGRLSGVVKRRRATKKKRAASSTRRRGRKLKFGSPAWRAKYLKKRRRTKRAR